MPQGAKNPNRRDIMDCFHENDATIIIAKSFGEFLYRILTGGKVPSGVKGVKDKSMYWLESEFIPYREYCEVCFD